MAEITVRFHTDQQDIDPHFFEQLRTLAEPYGLHLTDEQHLAKQYIQPSIEEFIRKADAIVEGMAPQTIDSVDLIREDREHL